MKMRMRDIPEAERPRERMEYYGARALSNTDLIAIFLRSGTAKASVMDIATQVLANYGSLTKLSKATLDELKKFPGIGRDKAVTLMAAFEIGRRIAQEIVNESDTLNNPEAIVNLLREENRSYTVETFQVVLLNTKRRLIRVEKISNGTLDALMVHPRDVFRPAIAANASAIVLVHNHPSGDPTPSEADIVTTRDLIRAGHLLKIEVLDHIIIGTKTQNREKDYISLRERGIFYP
jgi:DNA repair protein RadC